MTTSMVETKHMTLREFLALPEDGPYAELQHGEFVEMVRPSFEHNELVWKLLAEFGHEVEANALGRLSTDVLVVFQGLGDVTYAPDVVYVAKEHAGRVREGIVHGPPDLVVEVTSPRTAARDRGIKMDDYARAGVPWYWIIDMQTELIEEYELTPDGLFRRTQAVEGSGTFRPALFPGIEVCLDKLTT